LRRLQSSGHKKKLDLQKNSLFCFLSNLNLFKKLIRV